MVLNYFIIILLIILCALYSMWSSVSEAKVKHIERRNKSIDKVVAKGYKISKRWDCNAITIFSDKKKRVLSFLVMAWRKDTIYDIPIDSIKEITIGSVGIVKKSKMRTLITQIYLNIETEQGTYVLRTLYVKGIGLRKSSPHVAYAQKCAEEIRDYVYSLKN
ncbi:hypothetical protein I6E17_05600 [Fusobacterium perfoetens]|uniref:hypothetical protein n=1 Tax=Fusobacterium perfoetens TaxID=852 RepID=UPI0015A32C7F|nr:hypothetical protein [Fusobacterium perfoetens]MCF2625656.1 hypothetical protein [Fusobacterium perfoetens]